MNSSVDEHPAFARLIDFLDSTGQWRKLFEISDEFGPVLNDYTDRHVSVSSQSSPSACYLRRLFLRLGEISADELAELLLSVNLQAAADILHNNEGSLPMPPATTQPLQVQPLTATNSCDSSGRLLVSLNSRVEVFCSASGYPSPTYCWSFDQVELNDQNSSRLVIESFTAAHVGRYSCVVSQCGDNGGSDGGAPKIISAGCVYVLPSVSAPHLLECRVDGSVWWRPADVVVSEELQELQVQAPEGEPLQGQDQEERRGQEIEQEQPLIATKTLQCVWSGWPDPRISWHRNHVVINGKNGTTLDLSQLSCDMRSGHFVSIAQNSCGQTVSPVFHVAAPSVPVISRHPTPPHSRLAVGRTYTFTCHIVHRRPVHVVWRVSVADKNRAVSPSAWQTTVCADSALITSQLQWHVQESDARSEHRVTCEVMDADCFELRCMSDPAVFVATFSAHSKISLIIGNSRYKYLEPLHKVTEDVETFRCKIERLGFGTLVCMNVDLRLMWRVVRYFRRVASRGCYIVVFVAGHGFTHQRVDYLVPVDAQKQAADLMPPISQCLSLERLECVLQESGPAVIVMCADMCRSANLSTAEAGCSRDVLSPDSTLNQPYTITPSRNLLRLYSAQIGEAAFDDGRFMRHLLSRIGEDVSVQELGLHTLHLEGCQAPILEVSLPEKRGLLDGSDCETPLDNVVHRQHTASLADGSELYITERWNNYVCDECGADLRVTITLTPVGGDSGASLMSHCSVQMVVMLVCDSGTRQPLQFESGSESSRVSWWRCRLPLPPSPLQLLLVLLTGNGRRHGYRTPELCLSLNSMGLLKSRDIFK